MITAFKIINFFIKHVRVNFKDVIFIFDNQLKAFNVIIAMKKIIIAT